MQTETKPHIAMLLETIEQDEIENIDDATNAAENIWDAFSDSLWDDLMDALTKIKFKNATQTETETK